MRDTRLTIGKVAAQTGCSIETIRYYERQNLLPTPSRTGGGHRLYTSAMVRRLMFIRRCRTLGFSMDEIRQLLSLVDQEEVSCDKVKSIAETRLDDVRSRIADLRRMERTLADLSRRCAGGDAPDCPIIDSLFAGTAR